MFGLRVFGVHPDAELFIQQQDEGDGSRVWLHVEQAGVLHDEPATHTHTHRIYKASVFVKLRGSLLTAAD